MKLGQIAEKLGCAMEGDASLEITGVAAIEEAKKGDLTFLSDRKYRGALDKSPASAVIVAKEAAPSQMAARYFTLRHIFPRAFTRPPWCLLRQELEWERTSARTVLWTKMSRSAGMRCCTASSPFIEARALATISSHTHT
jgi:hypothetical protein